MRLTETDLTVAHYRDRVGHAGPMRPSLRLQESLICQIAVSALDDQRDIILIVPRVEHAPDNGPDLPVLRQTLVLALEDPGIKNGVPNHWDLTREKLWGKVYAAIEDFPVRGAMQNTDMRHSETSFLKLWKTPTPAAPREKTGEDKTSRRYLRLPDRNKPYAFFSRK